MNLSKLSFTFFFRQTHFVQKDVPALYIKFIISVEMTNVKMIIGKWRPESTSTILIMNFFLSYYF